jgi:hypothetical protein
MHKLFFEFARQVFEKSSNTKFHENPSSGSQAVSCGQADGQIDRLTDMTKLIVTFAVLRTPLKSFNPRGSIASAIKNAAGRKVDISTVMKEQIMIF